VAQLRIRFSKLGKIRFTSQRDVARMWERALRRTPLSVAQSQGFSPRPLLAFALGLPTGAESLAEYLDVRLATEDNVPELGELADLLSRLLPDGIEVTALERVDDGAPSLQQQVTSCSWELEVLGVTQEELVERVERLLDAPSLPVRRERKGRMLDDDLRPSVRSLTVLEAPDGGTAPARGRRLSTELATQPRGVRPRELVQVLGADVSLARARRTQQWIERGGRRYEPLAIRDAASAAFAPHAPWRAS
jgi:radical SAM-linked protein